MKKILSILLFSLLFVVIACNDDDYAPATYEYAAIESSDVPESISEDAGTSVAIPVVYGGKLSNPSSFTVNYSITGGTYGVDYTVVGGSSSAGSITVPAGATGTEAIGNIEILPTADLETEASVLLTITLESTSNGLSIGYPGLKELTLTIEDDDCEYVESEYEAAAGGREFYSDGSEYPDGDDYEVNFISLGGNEFQMDNFWDSGWAVTFTIDPATLVITVPEQDLPGGYHVSGTGKLSTCTKTMLIETHLFNDAGTYDDTHENRFIF